MRVCVFVCASARASVCVCVRRARKPTAGRPGRGLAGRARVFPPPLSTDRRTPNRTYPGLPEPVAPPEARREVIVPIAFRASVHVLAAFFRRLRKVRRSVVFPVSGRRRFAAKLFPTTVPVSSRSVPPRFSLFSRPNLSTARTGRTATGSRLNQNRGHRGKYTPTVYRRISTYK